MATTKGKGGNKVSNVKQQKYKGCRSENESETTRNKKKETNARTPRGGPDDLLYSRPPSRDVAPLNQRHTMTWIYVGS